MTKAAVFRFSSSHYCSLSMSFTACFSELSTAYDQSVGLVWWVGSVFSSMFSVFRVANYREFEYFSKDCRLPIQLQRAMAAEAEAAREARAKVCIWWCWESSAPRHVPPLLTPGNRGWRGTEGCPGLERGLRDHCGELLGDAITLSTSKRDFWWNITSPCSSNTIFQTLYSISSEKNHTIVFPLPIDVIGHMVGGGGGGGKHQTPPCPVPATEREKKSLWREQTEKQSRNILITKWISGLKRHNMFYVISEYISICCWAVEQIFKKKTNKFFTSDFA